MRATKSLRLARQAADGVLSRRRAGDDGVLMRGERGIAMIMALFVAGLLLVVGMLLLDNVLAVATNVVDVKQKNQIFDAAEAGLNTAIDLLDRTPNAAAGAGSCTGGNLQGYDFTCGIIVNQLKQSSPVSGVIDPITSKVMSSVPAGMAVIYGSSSAVGGGRVVSVEALVGLQATNIQLPRGAVNAKLNIGGSSQAPINGDPTDLTNPNDADIHSNANIAQFETKSGNVHGNTYAVGTDAQPGFNGTELSGADTVPFPSDSAVRSFANSAATAARNGTYITAAAFMAASNPTYSGNVYIDGTVDMTQGTATFAGAGSTIYVNGSLCLSGRATMLNSGGSTFVVRDQYAVSGNAQAYNVTPGTQGVMLVMGTDQAPPCTGGTGPWAVNLGGNTNADVGAIYAPFGSVQLAGNGDLTGSIDAGGQVLFNGSPGGAFTYDRNVSGLVLKGTGNVQIRAFAEYESAPTN